MLISFCETLFCNKIIYLVQQAFISSKEKVMYPESLQTQFEKRREVGGFEEYIRPASFCAPVSRGASSIGSTCLEVVARFSTTASFVVYNLLVYSVILLPGDKIQREIAEVNDGGCHSFIAYLLQLIRYIDISS